MQERHYLRDLLRAFFNYHLSLEILKGTRLIAEPNGNKVEDWKIHSYYLSSL